MEGKEYKGKYDDLVSKNAHDVHVIWMMNSIVDKFHVALWYDSLSWMQYRYSIYCNYENQVIVQVIWFARNITLSQQGWHYPDGPIIQFCCSNHCTLLFITSNSTESNLRWPMLLIIQCRCLDRCMRLFIISNPTKSPANQTWLRQSQNNHWIQGSYNTYIWP
jgi:hypothetical protein